MRRMIVKCYKTRLKLSPEGWLIPDLPARPFAYLHFYPKPTKELKEGDECYVVIADETSFHDMMKEKGFTEVMEIIHYS